MNPELEDHLYAQVAREVAANNYHPAPMARAAEKAAGNADIAKSLYIKFRVEQLAREVEQEARRRQIESERRAQQAAEERRAQIVAETKRKTGAFFRGVILTILLTVLILIALGFLGQQIRWGF